MEKGRQKGGRRNERDTMGAWFPPFVCFGLSLCLIFIFYFSGSLELELLLDCYAFWVRRRERGKEGREVACKSSCL